MFKNIKVIAFDADDTLWVNEPYFQATEHDFCDLLKDFLPQKELSAELLKVEIKNIPIYGYGIKGFILSMIETALQVTDNQVDTTTLSKIITLGQAMLNQKIELLEGVENVLESLYGKYKLVLATKGDLLDQERKLQRSGLEKYFHHIEIMSEKDEKGYQKLLQHLDIQADTFLMIGNSLKSDILPVLNLGANAVHIPYHTTWALERVEGEIEHENFCKISKIIEILNFV
jgi:putative hydrolase of the HAD superfamily